MLYVFGDCTLDLRCYTLHRAGVFVSLGPKAFSVLAYLLQHRDRVVLKQELSDLLWPGQFVSDTALTQCIASLRKAVGDTGDEQQIIKTLYGHGYRFIAAVDERPFAPPADMVLMKSPIPHPPNGQAMEPAEAFPDLPPSALDQGELLPCAPSPLPKQHGELRQVTVLCGALSHTEVLAARLDPEVLHRLIYGFFAHAKRTVQHCGGMIQTFLDDGFLALFGVPDACEHHAQQALRAATQLRQSLHTQGTNLSALCGEAVMVRLGMHTGTVVGRRIEDDQRLIYMAVGDTMRTAMRLQQLAEPDTLLLSDPTAQQVQEAVVVKACGPVGVHQWQQHGQVLRPAYTV